jgi:hypothetical protein
MKKLFFLFFLFLLLGCDDKRPPGPHDIEPTAPPSQVAQSYRVVKTTHDGHDYLIFKYREDHGAQDGFIGIVHDPDCKCGRDTK